MIAAMSAEITYLFRHALLRDAAYELQLPSDRAALHAVALGILEAAYGGPPPGPVRDKWGESTCRQLPIDSLAAELALHARAARQTAANPDQYFRAREILYLRRAAEYCERSFQCAEAVSSWQALGAQLAGREKAQALHRAGVQANLSGRATHAESLLSQALESAQRGTDQRVEGRVLAAMANVYRETGRVEQAQQAHEQAVAIYRKVGDRRSEGAVLGNLAIAYRESGCVAQAERTYEQALAIQREAGDRRSEGVTLGNLANVYQNTGRFEQAEQAHERAIAIHREVGDRRSEGAVLGNLAIVYQYTGRFEQAERTHTQALAIHREVGNRRTEGMTLGNLAIVCQATGRDEQAERAFEQALAIHREVGNRRFEGITLGSLAGLYGQTGRIEQAGQTYERAIAIQREVGDRHSEGLTLCDYALCLLAQRRHEPARGRWREGTALLQVLKDTAELERRRIDMRDVCAKAGVPPFDEAAP